MINFNKPNNFYLGRVKGNSISAQKRRYLFYDIFLDYDIKSITLAIVE